MPRLAAKLTKWFDIPEDPLKGRLLLVHLDAADLQEIGGKTVDSKIITKGQNAQGQQLVEGEIRVDKIKERELVAVLAVQAWENHQDAAGKPLDCTPENKRLYSRDPEWMRFVNEKLQELAKEADALAEAARKN